MRQETISRIANFIAAGIAYVKPVKTPSEAVKHQDIPNGLGNLSRGSRELLQSLVNMLPMVTRPGELILPQYVVEKGNSAKTIFVQRWFPGLKEVAAAEARRIAAQSNSEFVAFLCGGYELPESLRHEERAILDKHGSIENYPDKSEVVFIHLATRHGHYGATVTIWPKIRRELEQVSWKSVSLRGSIFLRECCPRSVRIKCSGTPVGCSGVLAWAPKSPASLPEYEQIVDVGASTAIKPIATSRTAASAAPQSLKVRT